MIYIFKKQIASESTLFFLLKLVKIEIMGCLEVNKLAIKIKLTCQLPYHVNVTHGYSFALKCIFSGMNSVKHTQLKDSCFLFFFQQ